MTIAISAHTARLNSREEIAKGIMIYHFAKPADFRFRAGQSVDITLLDPPETDAEGRNGMHSASGTFASWRSIPRFGSRCSHGARRGHVALV
jgi:hypothetical protein